MPLTPPLGLDGQSSRAKKELLAGENPIVPHPPAMGDWDQENLLAMKSIILLIGLGLLTLVGTVGCEEEHEHHHGPYGGAYDANYRGYGHEGHPGWPDEYHH